eukprot:COSAG06_NODE_4390_length_4307_cov_3.484553_6_plen_88_part_00
MLSNRPTAQLPNQLPNCPTCALVPVSTTQEANYGHQQELDMIPLMMQKDYSPKGWLGLILGTRMWYATFPAALCLSRLSSLVEMHCQ